MFSLFVFTNSHTYRTELKLTLHYIVVINPNEEKTTLFISSNFFVVEIIATKLIQYMKKINHKQIGSTIRRIHHREYQKSENEKKKTENKQKIENHSMIITQRTHGLTLRTSSIPSIISFL